MTSPIWHNELTRLNELWSSGGGEFIVTFERKPARERRALREFFRDKSHAYFVARSAPERDLLTDFSSEIARMAADKVLEREPLLTWPAVFTYLTAYGGRSRFVLVLDRFEFLRLATPMLPTLLQAWCNDAGRLLQILVLVYECGLPQEFVTSERQGEPTAI